MNNLQKKFNNCFSGDFNGHFKVILVQIPESRHFVDLSHCYCCMTAPMRSLKWRYYLLYVIFIIKFVKFFSYDFEGHVKVIKFSR